MGLKQDFNDDVEEIFAEFADIQTQVTYKSHVSSANSPGGVVTPTYTDYPIGVIIAGYNDHDAMNETINNDDMKILIASKNLGFTPTTKDVIVLPSGDEVKSMSVKIDPSESLYIVQGRK